MSFPSSHSNVSIGAELGLTCGTVEQTREGPHYSIDWPGYPAFFLGYPFSRLSFSHSTGISEYLLGSISTLLPSLPTRISSRTPARPSSLTPPLLMSSDQKVSLATNSWPLHATRHHFKRTLRVLSYPRLPLLYTWETESQRGTERCPRSHGRSLTLLRAPPILPSALPPLPFFASIFASPRTLFTGQGVCLSWDFMPTTVTSLGSHFLVLSWGLHSRATGLGHTEG